MLELSTVPGRGVVKLLTIITLKPRVYPSGVPNHWWSDSATGAHPPYSVLFCEFGELISGTVYRLRASEGQIEVLRQRVKIEQLHVGLVIPRRALMTTNTP